MREVVKSRFFHYLRLRACAIGIALLVTLFLIAVAGVIFFFEIGEDWSPFGMNVVLCLANSCMGITLAFCVVDFFYKEKAIEANRSNYFLLRMKFDKVINDFYWFFLASFNPAKYKLDLKILLSDAILKEQLYWLKRQGQRVEVGHTNDPDQLVRLRKFKLSIEAMQSEYSRFPQIEGLTCYGELAQLKDYYCFLDDGVHGVTRGTALNPHTIFFSLFIAFCLKFLEEIGQIDVKLVKEWV